MLVKHHSNINSMAWKDKGCKTMSSSQAQQTLAMAQRRYCLKKVWFEEDMVQRRYGSKKIWFEEDMVQRRYGS